MVSGLRINHFHLFSIWGYFSYTRCASPPLDQQYSDLHICGKVNPIDGLGSILGFAAPRVIRTESGLPLTGMMQFDSADVERLKTFGTFGPVILHEMVSLSIHTHPWDILWSDHYLTFYNIYRQGHILGIGTRWAGNNVTGPVQQNCPYRGTAANREWKAITGCPVIPTENDGRPNDGTFCGQ